MKVTEKELINALEKEFPDHIIFAEQHNHDSHSINYAIYQHAKAEGLSSVQWLTSRGFMQKELSACRRKDDEAAGMWSRGAVIFAISAVRRKIMPARRV